MLAGVLMKLVLGLFPAFETQPLLVAIIVMLFLFLRLVTPSMAILIALGMGIAISYVLGINKPTDTFVELSSLTIIWPAFDWNSMIGLGIPLYIVTMTAQNIAGVAVLKNDGYLISTRSALSCTGVVSALTAFFGAHTCNLSAITASICTGPDTHPDKTQRWKVGPVYAGVNVFFAIFGASLVAVFAAMPPALIATIAGLALLGPLTNAANNALAIKVMQFPAIVTLAVTLSSLQFFGISSAFWGLVAGLMVIGLEKIKTTVSE
jgi:benzoate membrane transport protein